MNIIKFSFFALFLILLVTGCSTLPDEKQNSNYSDMLLNQATNYYLSEDYEKAIECYSEVYNQYVILDLTTEKITMAFRIAKVYYSMKDSIQSNRWVNIAKINGMKNSLFFNSQLNLYEVNKLFYQKKYSELLRKFEFIKTQNMETDDRLLILSLITIAKQKLNLEFNVEFVDVLSLYHSISDNNNSDLFGYISFLIGNIYYDEEDYSESISYFQKAAEIDLKSGNYFGLADCFEKLGDVYFNLNNLNLAAYNYNKSAEWHNVVNNKTKAGKLFNKANEILPDNNKDK